jgi:CO/xanthine dehydrogenase Mo-binding subunit
MAHDNSYTGQKFQVIGNRFARPDGVDKVTGRARYGADANAPGQLVARVLRSPHAHARIKKIDTSKAEKLSGVKAVITSDDLPDLTGGNRGMTDILENCMARGRALYDGHAVAAVAAIDEQTARKALKLIKVTYQMLPHVTDVDEAMQPEAPVIHDWVFTGGMEPKPTKPSNVANRTEMGHGDVDAGFAAADVIVERSYKTEQTHQGYIEPHACLASVNPDGSAELWVTTQGPFSYRNVCAGLLGLDIAKLKVTASEIGGGFGGKTHVWAEPLALALSRKANRPVKLVMTREEVFRATGPTASTSIDVKIGAKKNGEITAATLDMRYQGGAFPGIWGMLGCMTGFACYDIKNQRSVGWDVIVNRPKVAAYGHRSRRGRHGCGGFPSQKRRQGGLAGTLRSDLRSHRHRVRVAGGEETPADEGPPEEEPGKGRRLRLLVQHRWSDLCGSQHRRRRHRQSGSWNRRRGRRALVPGNDRRGGTGNFL